MEERVIQWNAHQTPGGFTLFVVADGRFPLHRHRGFCELVFAWKGEFRHRINGRVTVQREREVTLIREEDSHELLGGEGEVVNLPFTAGWIDRAEALVQKPGSLKSVLFGEEIPRTQITEETWPLLRSQLEQLMHHGDDLRGRLCFCGILLSLMHACVRSPSVFGEERRGFPVWLEALLVELDLHPADDYRVSDLVRLGECTPAHLARSFRRFLGKTPSQFLNERRLHQAARLLLHSTSRIAEISYRIGIDDPTYFCRLFRKHYGETPSEYRAHQKNQGHP